MKVLYGSVLIVAIAVLGIYAWKPIRVQTFLLPGTLKTGWVTIEYENPKCPSLSEGRLWQDHVIPDSGYLCTSSQRETGWFYRNYYLVRADGTRRRLAEGKEIFKENALYLGAGNTDCKVVANSFWYGPQEQIDNQQHAVLERLHPECVKGLVTPTQ